MHPSGPLPSPRATDTAGRRLGFAVLIASLVATGEWAGGQLAGSLALLADAGHMALDVFALLLAYVARRFAQRPPTARAPFGLKRAEVLAALVNGISLLGIAFVIGYEAIERAQSPASIDVVTMGGVACIGFLANILSLRLLHGHQHNIGLRGAFLHLLGDAANSLAVVVGAACIWAFGHTWIDPVVSFVIAIVVALSSLPLMAHALGILLLLAPHPERDRLLAERCAKIRGVHLVQKFRVWRLTGHEFIVSAQILLAEGDLHAEHVREQVRSLLLEAYPAGDITVEVATASRAEKAPLSFGPLS